MFQPFFASSAQEKAETLQAKVSLLGVFPPETCAMFRLSLSITLLALVVAEICQVEYVTSKYECPSGDDRNLESLARTSLSKMSPMTLEVLHKTGAAVKLPPVEKMNEGVPEKTAIEMQEKLYMTCSQGWEDFPNACSAAVQVHVTEASTVPFLPEKWTAEEAMKLNRLPAGDRIKREIKLYGMAMYFYSTYEEKTGKVRDVIDLRFALGDHGLCSAEVRLTSGECFGMKMDGKPHTPADPPKPPVLKDVGPEFPELHAKQVPGLGAGPIIVIVLLLLALLVAAAGALAFFLRRQRSQEERALRGVQEVELNSRGQ
eukprot:s1049_g3.t1